MTTTRSFLLLVLLVFGAAIAGAGCEGPRGRAGDDGEPGPTGSPGPTPYVEPGETFVLTLTSADVAATSNTLSVFFLLTDDEGVPRTRDGMSLNWTAAVLLDDVVTGFPAWSSYFTKPVSGAFGDTDQPTSDSAGTYTDLGEGQYRYDFSVALQAGFEQSKTHRIGVYARRADASLRDGYEIENDWLDFVPDGSDVTETREVVMTENCNTCHDPLKAHGEFRREVELCVTCHNPGLYDPDTEDTYDPGSGAMNPLDLKVLVHRIHQGVELPSLVKAAARGEVGFKYSVIGYNSNEFVVAEVTPDNKDAGTVPEITGVAFPRDQQNCTTCHTGGADSGRHRTTVTREACGACHDSTWFGSLPAPATMDSHAGGVFASDVACASCHVADMTTEFDLSVQGAHVIPTRSEQLPGFAYEILSAALVGSQLSIVFTVENGDGTPVTSLATLSSIAAIVNGPTSDYRLDNYYRRDLKTNVPAAVYDAGSETWSVTLQNRTGTDPYFPSGNVVPPGSTGTFAVGLEARRTVAVPGYGNVTEGAPNPVFYFSVDGSDVSPRRTIVETETCNVCHDRLSLHGGQRREVEYCVLCHNPQNVDWSQRPKLGGAGTNVNLANTEDDIEERSIDFRTMIHKVHTGEELDASVPYVIYGYGAKPYFFDEVRFPGDRRRCTTCHNDDTYLVESVPEDALPVTANQTDALFHAGTIAHQFGEDEIPPVTAACIACHDNDGARVHAELNTNGSGEESCVVCHGENREFSVREVHGEGN